MLQIDQISKTFNPGTQNEGGEPSATSPGLTMEDWERFLDRAWHQRFRKIYIAQRYCGYV